MENAQARLVLVGHLFRVAVPRLKQITPQAKQALFREIEVGVLDLPDSYFEKAAASGDLEEWAAGASRTGEGAEVVARAVALAEEAQGPAQDAA